MLHGVVAEQDRGLLAGLEARGDRLVLVASASTPSSASDARAAATAMPASASGSFDGATIALCATFTSQSSSTECSIDTSAPLRAAWRKRCATSGWSLRRKLPTTSDAIELADLGDGHAEPRNALRLAIAAEVGLAQPEVDVVAAEAAHEARCERQFLERGMRRHERAERARAVPRDDVGQSLRDDVERGLPVDRLPLAALLDHRRAQAIFAS